MTDLSMLETTTSAPGWLVSPIKLATNSSSELILFLNNIPSDIDLPMPLILAVWHEASHEQKKESFKEQILIANKYGLIQRVSYFIMQLKDDELLRHESNHVDPETGNLLS